MGDNESKSGERERGSYERREIPMTAERVGQDLPPMPPGSSSPGFSYPYFFNDEQVYRTPPPEFDDIDYLR